MAEYVADCMRCGAKRMSFDVLAVGVVHNKLRSDRNFAHHRYMNLIELACQCRHCRYTTLFLLRAYSSSASDLPSVEIGSKVDPRKLGYEQYRTIPANSEILIPTDVPEPARSFFEQGARALEHQLYDAAGAMFRKCLESATRSDDLLAVVPAGERDALKSKWLKARITKLKELHAIPPALADLVDVIKDAGDEAVHEDALYDQESAKSLARFTTTMLEQLFTIPAQIRKVKSEVS